MTHIRPYRDYVESGSYWIGDVPAGWSTKRLRHIASFWNSNVDKKTYEDQQSVLLCNYTDVYYNEFIRPGLQFMGATASTKEIGQFTLRCGDIIVTKDSEDASDIGIPTLVTNDLPGVVCGYHLTLIRTSEEVSPRFLHRAIQAHPSKAYFNVESPGITRFGLGQDTIGDLPIVFPAVSDQEKISDWIDSQTSRIDTLIEKKVRFTELLKEKRQALITHAVTKGLNPDAPMKDSGIEWLGEVPAHWDICRIGSLYREAVREGSTSLPILSISIHDGISDDELAPEDRARKITQIEDRTKYKRVKPNDLAYNMMRAWQGAFGAVLVNGLVSPAYVVAQPIREIQSLFVEKLLRTPMAVEEMRRFSRGITDFRMRLYWEYFREIKICVPPIDEQLGILSKLDQQCSRIDTLKTATERSIGLLKERRSALITAAVTGKIDLRDAA